jgi:hypothetical protein
MITPRKTIRMTKQVYEVLQKDGELPAGKWVPCPTHWGNSCVVCLGHGELFEVADASEYPLDLGDA